MSVRRKITTKPLESTVHRQICEYIRLAYPHVIFRTDYAAGLKLTKYQAAMNKILSSDRGYPDVFLAEPRGRYCGLYLEVKREGVIVYLKDGTLSTNAHIQEQAEVLQALMNKGYYATFALGFEAAKAKIDAYMALGPHKTA